MKKFKLKRKYAYGGTPIQIDSPSQSLAEAKRISDDAYAGSMNSPEVLGLRLLGQTLTSKGLGLAGKGFAEAGNLDGIGGFLQDNFGYLQDATKLGMGVSTMATGGTVNKSVEVEGQEVAELPNGDVGKFEGPSHENGGIETNLPAGTDIYSKRVKVNGEKMSDRKIAREKKLRSIEKLLEKNPLDKNLKNTYERIKANTEMLDEKDMLIQNTLHSFNKGMKRAFGGTLGEDEYSEEDEEIQNEYLEEEEEEFDEALYEEENSIIEDDEYDEDEEEFEYEEFALGGSYNPNPIPLKYKHPSLYNMANSYLFDQDPLTKQILDTSDRPMVEPVDSGLEIDPVTTEEEGFNPKSLLGNFSIGDMIGMAGSMYGGLAGRKNTLKNRAGDTPNINPYATYGVKGLKTLEGAKESLQYNKDANIQDLNRSKQSAISRNRNSARGVNTMRALDLATDSMTNNATNKVYQDYASRLSNIMSQQANMENSKDAMFAQGEIMRDTNDRRDRDNFFSQLGLDNQSLATAIQHLGKNLNTGLERELNADALSQLSKWFQANITADGMTLKNKTKK